MMVYMLCPSCCFPDSGGPGLCLRERRILRNSWGICYSPCVGCLVGCPMSSAGLGVVLFWGLNR